MLPNLVQHYAAQLAPSLGRSEAEVRRGGLQATDFRDTLHLEFADGSHATFHGAFFLHSPAEWAVVVFTEHCGYLVFPDALRIRTEAGAVFDGLG